jgi:hypothetical protein
LCLRPNYIPCIYIKVEPWVTAIESGQNKGFSTSLGQAASECFVTTPSLVRCCYSSDVQIASSALSRLSVMHGDPHPPQPPDLLDKFLPSSFPDIYVCGPKQCSSSERYPVKCHEKQCYSRHLSSKFFIPDAQVIREASLYKYICEGQGKLRFEKQKLKFKIYVFAS